MLNCPEIASACLPVPMGLAASAPIGWTLQRAHQLFDAQHRRGLARRVWSMVSGRAARLDRLGAALAARPVRQCHALGVKTIPIRAICGSENRCGDFDRWFAPLTSVTRARWQRLAAAKLNGEALPAIEVVQLGGCYFVRDGHHRVSVARALGEEYIEADVTLWEVAAASTAAPSDQPDRASLAVSA